MQFLRYYHQIPINEKILVKNFLTDLPTVAQTCAQRKNSLSLSRTRDESLSFLLLTFHVLFDRVYRRLHVLSHVLLN
jgi:hypothetical protein